MTREEFVRLYGGLFEHSSYIAENAYDRLESFDRQHIYEQMCKIVVSSPIEAKLALLRAHPMLAGKEAEAGELTSASQDEQQSAKLNALSPEDMQKISHLNKSYFEKFQFPFIIAVKNYSKKQIFEEFEKRLLNSREQERETAIQQVLDIAKIRLESL